VYSEQESSWRRQDLAWKLKGGGKAQLGKERYKQPAAGEKWQQGGAMKQGGRIYLSCKEMGSQAGKERVFQSLGGI
jgi:hypothetical protein